MTASPLIREHAAALYEHTRNLTLVRLADLGHAAATWADDRVTWEDTRTKSLALSRIKNLACAAHAWAETRDLDTDWADFQESNR